MFITLSCWAQLKKFTVDVPYAPKFKISDSIQSFTILNRSLTPEFENYNEDSLQISFYKKNFAVSTNILDSLVSDTTIKVLGDMLYNSERYDIVIPVERNIYRLLPYNKSPEPLSWNYVEKICEEFNTDALIVLENIAMHTVTNYQTQKEYVDFGYEKKSYYASIDFYSWAHWKIYYPKNKEILVDCAMNEDTLYWDSYEYDLKQTFLNLPSIKEAAIETGTKIAQDFSNMISPQWKQETRYYYILDDSAIDESIRMAAAGDWEGALQNWQNNLEKGSSIKRSKIMLNLALAYEMTGDLQNAVEWSRKSQKLYYREVTNHYLKLLLTRLSKTK